MILNFYVRFYTKPGESMYVSGTGNSLGNNDSAHAVALKYLNNDFWYGKVVLDAAGEKAGQLQYKYILKGEDGNYVVEWENERLIDLQDSLTKEITLIDTWNHAGTIENAFFTKPFQEVFLADALVAKPEATKIYTHEFRVKAPLLKSDEVICLAGSVPSLQNWKTTKPLLLNKKGNWWSVKVDIGKEAFPITYKYGVFNTREKKFSHFESGSNRFVPDFDSKEKITILHDGFVQLYVQGWKGAGVAIPVFSLRSENSFGTGEFTDLKLMVDWAKACGLKMIQLLPVNDTTATHTWKDSYPYAAISAFALHPIYLNLSQVASDKNPDVIKDLYLNQKALNDKPVLDYDEVMRLKFAAIKALYAAQKDTLATDKDYKAFFEVSKHWLVPYAAFSYLRDKYNSADPSTWKTNSNYDEAAIQELVDPSQKQYDAIAVNYFIQYHLHLQLKAATAYAHANGVAVKGDLPIGISRQSCDAWVNPALYYMNKQAGAPPDDFAVKGQNWGFPTYNWGKMKQDHYAWWRQRFEQMGFYFDAFRIDHILGFFRIWSIPLDAVQGILGRFVPAIPIHVNELYHSGISFHPNRYCKPFIDDSTISEIFGSEAGYVKEVFLDYTDGNFQLKPYVDTQRKIESHFNEKPANEKNEWLKRSLYDLASNIIFIEEEGSNMQQLHFRINMDQTPSFRRLDGHTQNRLKELYINYFYYRQDQLWKKEALEKLPELKHSTDMLVFGEDLGMVPDCVPDVMQQIGVLSLEIQRMPKLVSLLFAHPNDAPYMSLITPSTHDMSTVRGWWEEDHDKTQFFYNRILGHYGKAPQYCEPWICKEILVQHFYSPAMWCAFQLQDILGMSEKLRRQNPNDERINVPANPDNYWQYRMHISLEDLIKEQSFNDELREMIAASGRL